MSIYTRAGDSGTTRLGDGTPVAKSAARVNAYGTIDEANSFVGCARCAVADPAVDGILRFSQQRLLNCSSAIAASGPPDEPLVTAGDVVALEAAIDAFEGRVGGFRGFVLPSGCEAVARLHVARTVVRRAERECVTLAEEPASDVDRHVLAFLNRLSDLLFAAARIESVAAGASEELWDRQAVPPNA